MRVRWTASGPTIYAYVGNDPLGSVDPLGLDANDISETPAQRSLEQLHKQDHDVINPLVDTDLNNDGVQDVVSPVVLSGGAGKASGSRCEKASIQLLKNKETGDAFERKVMEMIQLTQSNVVQQITIKTKSGTRTRIDLMGRDKDGNIVCTECKSSETAPLTINQKRAFPEVKQTGAVVVGKGKSGFPGGTEIPSGTNIEIIRP